MPKQRILVVDDEGGIRFGLREYFEAKGYEVQEADSCRTAEDAYLKFAPHVVLLDMMLPDGNGLDLLVRLKQIDPTIPFVILTAHGSIDLAVRAMKEGAEQFLTKPVELPTLQLILERIAENRRNQRVTQAARDRIARASLDPFAGTSEVIHELARQCERVAKADVPVLLRGETGTGKGVLARWLHLNGPRAEESFVDLNTAGLSRELLESELFGHEKGAFTGAVVAKQGLLEIANRGTVFLDEIGDMDLQVQPKLLTALEDKRFRRVGEVRDRQVDVRLITATHQNLPELVREKRFRSDLYFRINTVSLTVPALRERRADIPMLAASILARIGADVGCPDLRLSPDAIVTLQSHPWPGNLRELKNVLERAVLLREGSELGRSDFRFENFADSGEDESPMTTLVDLERQHIERVLREENGQVRRAAERLGIARSSLYNKIKQFGIRLSPDA